MPPPYIPRYTMSPLEKRKKRMFVAHSYLSPIGLSLMLFCQSIDLVKTTDTFY